jgi:hypothetical protein
MNQSNAVLLHDMTEREDEMKCRNIINKSACVFLRVRDFGRGKRPVVFGNAGPEDPDHDD